MQIDKHLKTKLRIMKKLFFSAALALFVVAAIAQTKTTTKSDVSVTSKNTKKDKEKSTEVSGTAKSKSDVEFRQDDADRDGKLSAEEKTARKEAKKSRKSDRTDDGLLNGSGSEKNIHGKTVSELATGTTLEGREKGAAISAVAKANSNGELNREEKSGDSKMSIEEKIARKETRKEENKTRKADRDDDGLLNGSSDKNIRGKATSGTAVGTNLRGKAKGVEVSTGARAKARVGTGLDVSVGKNPRKKQ